MQLVRLAVRVRAAPLCVLAVLALCAAGLSACRSLPFPEPHLEGEYGALLRRWTLERALYAGLETRAFVQVVYLAPELVDAQAAKVSDMRAEPAPQRAHTLEAMRAAAATPTFVAVVRTPNRDWNDLESKTSSWRLAIDYGAGQFDAERIERFERPWPPELQTLYPYVDDWSVAYRIHFPVASVTTPPPPGNAAPHPMPRLVMAGALGKMLFDWSGAEK
jgi:hypothetical protein